MITMEVEKETLWVAQFLTYLGFYLSSQPVDLDIKGGSA